MSESVQKKSVLTSWKNVTKNLGTFVNGNKLKGLPHNLKMKVEKVQKNVNGLVNKDLESIKNKFKSEKKNLESLVDKVINAELDKAKKFVADQKKEIGKIQKTIEGYIAKSKKTNGSKSTVKTTAKKVKTTAKRTTAKKATRKA